MSIGKMGAWGVSRGAGAGAGPKDERGESTAERTRQWSLAALLAPPAGGFDAVADGFHTLEEDLAERGLDRAIHLHVRRRADGSVETAGAACLSAGNPRLLGAPVSARIADRLAAHAFGTWRTTVLEVDAPPSGRDVHARLALRNASGGRARAGLVVVLPGAGWDDRLVTLAWSAEGRITAAAIERQRRAVLCDLGEFRRWQMGLAWREHGLSAALPILERLAAGGDTRTVSEELSLPRDGVARTLRAAARALGLADGDARGAFRVYLAKRERITLPFPEPCGL